MPLRKLKQFREQTRKQYKEEIEKEMEPWKKDVLLLHEKSEYLFYCDELEPESPGSKTMVIRGEHVKGHPEIRMPLYLYDGQGTLLGQGVLMSDSEEKEEKRRGFLRSRKNEFLLELTAFHGKIVSECEEKEYRRMLRNLFMELSLLSDKKFMWERNT